MAKANSMPVQAVSRAFVLRMVGTPFFCKLQLSASLAAEVTPYNFVLSVPAGGAFVKA